MYPHPLYQFPFQFLPAPQQGSQNQYFQSFKTNLSVFISDFEESLGGPDIFNYFKKFGQIRDVMRMQKKASAIVSFYNESDGKKAGGKKARIIYDLENEFNIFSFFLVCSKDLLL